MAIISANIIDMCADGILDRGVSDVAAPTAARSLLRTGRGRPQSPVAGSFSPPESKKDRPAIHQLSERYDLDPLSQGVALCTWIEHGHTFEVEIL